MKIVRLNKKTVNHVLSIFEATMPEYIYELIRSDMRRLRRDGVKMFGFKYRDDGPYLAVSGYFYEDDQYWLGWTAVDPVSQGKGFGGTLLDGIEQMILKESRGRAKLSIMTYGHPFFISAIAFYLKHGFQFDRVSDIRVHGMKVIVLSKTLSRGTRK